MKTAVQVRAVLVRKTGGPEVLEVADVDVGGPGPREILVEVAAAGVNYIDTYQRAGIYPIELPAVLGMEGAGTVGSVGSEVSEFAPGDRVAWQGAPGSYAQRTLVPADIAVKVPDGVSDEIAAATLLQGITAMANGENHLITSAYLTSAVAFTHRLWREGVLGLEAAMAAVTAQMEAAQ